MTFTSCKDYDDDIDRLDTDITDVRSQLTTLDADVSSAQTAASDALAKANEALAAAEAANNAEAIAALEEEIAGIQAQLEALSGLEAEVTALMQELTDANAAQLEEIRAEAQALSEQLLAMVGGMVTQVELVSAGDQVPPLDLTIAAILEKDNVFEEGITNAITFTEGTQHQTPVSFVIRVSPTNAEITPEMVTLQNSLGETYENMEVVSVEPFDELLTRSTNGSGLWEVTVQLQEYDEEEFNAATVDPNDDTKQISFFVAVDNTQTVENPMIRKVVSTYDLTLAWDEEFTGAAALDFSVDETSVADINNRYTTNELRWSGDPDVEATDDNTTPDTGDNRNVKDAYPAVQGQPLTISLVNDDNLIRAMYVTLDYEENTTDISEWNAWNGYSYTGLGTVVEGTETQITISSSTAISDEIGFRVFAVNYDGTLVDPDGKAFYVNLGEEATSWNALNTVVTATDDDDDATTVASEEVAATLSELTDADEMSWTTDAADDDDPGTAPSFHAYFVDADGDDVFNTETNDASGVSFEDVTAVYTKATVNDWLAYVDNKVYEGTLTIKNATGHVLATLDVTFKKVLPTEPEGFLVKSGQLASNGVYYSYLIPNIWTAPNATTGTMDLDNVFNFGAGTVGRYETTFAASAEDADGELTDIVVPGGGILSVGKAFIDNTEQHATTVEYNFGKISTETTDADGNVIDYKKTIEEFPTVYSNIYNNTYSWRWATREDLELGDEDEMPYSTDVEYGSEATVDLQYIYGVSTRNSSYNAFLNDPYNGSLVITDAMLISNSNEEEEYFDASYNVTDGTITLDPVSDDSNPTADVPSTLVITVQDMYGNEFDIELQMTVKKL